MKKLILISLCAVLCLSFCACKGNGDESSSDNTTAPASTAATTASSSDAKKASDSAETTANESSPFESAKEAAVAEAKGFLEKANYSYTGLYNELLYMGYAEEDAKYGVDNCGADWNEQAIKRAKALASQGDYTEENLVEKLESEGFTQEQASIGAQVVIQSPDSKSKKSDSAVEAARKYFDTGNFTYTSLIDKLEQDGYSQEEAEYAADNCGADWNAQAAKEAEALLKDGLLTKEEIVDKLIFKGYTYEQAVYGAEANGF